MASTRTKTKPTVIYADTIGSFKVIEEPVRRQLFSCLKPGQGEDGYGSKITTDYKVVFADSARKYRVYATCYSNVASHWIICNKKKYHLRDGDF